jgi:hypothetical protein
VVIIILNIKGTIASVNNEDNNMLEITFQGVVVGGNSSKEVLKLKIANKNINERTYINRTKITMACSDKIPNKYLILFNKEEFLSINDNVVEYMIQGVFGPQKGPTTTRKKNENTKNLFEHIKGMPLDILLKPNAKGILSDDNLKGTPIEILISY